MWVDQSMETFKHFWIANPNKPTCMMSFGSNLYANDQYGSIYMSTVVVAAGNRGVDVRWTYLWKPSLLVLTQVAMD
jgi:hypothetical protein